MSNPDIQKRYAALEENILERTVKSQAPVDMYLLNGIKLQGYIIQFDNDTILIKSNLKNSIQYQLIYKHTISTILPDVDLLNQKDNKKSKEVLLLQQ